MLDAPTLATHLQQIIALHGLSISAFVLTVKVLPRDDGLSKLMREKGENWQISIFALKPTQAEAYQRGTQLIPLAEDLHDLLRGAGLAVWRFDLTVHLSKAALTATGLWYSAFSADEQPRYHVLQALYDASIQWTITLLAK